MSKKAPGLEVYTPNRLDWLMLQLNSLFQHEGLAIDGFEIYYLSELDGESISIIVNHNATVNKELMNSKIEVAKRAVLTFADRYGWESWVKVNVEVKEIE